MSLATRCTACGTIFRVVQDQLRVSEGWVRCGRCAEVFDAREQLFDLDREAPPPWPPNVPDAPSMPAHESAFVQEPALRSSHGAATPPPSAVPAPQAAPYVQPHASPQSPPFAPPPFAPPHRLPEREPTPAWHHDPAPMSRGDAAGTDSGLDVLASAGAATRAAGAEASVEMGAISAQPGGRREPFWEPTPVAEPDAREDFPEPKGLKFEEPERAAPASRETAAEAPRSSFRSEGTLPANQDLGPDVVLSPRLKSARAEATSGETSPADADVDKQASALPSRKPGFLRRAEGEARWQRPGVRLALGLGSVLLLLGAAAQLTWHYRDALATQSPLARQWLAGACEKLGCQLQPWRRLDAFSVESSGLSEAASGNHYKFSLSLRNKSPWELATPWVELSLNDGSGQVLMKKALRPEDFSNGRPSMGANSEQALQLVFSTGRQRVNGYTVEIFYP